ncbi:MAG TPA: CCA tRNA nucleotidyltransferase [Gemmatimonadaceae bacterium]|nr:CCA tRNA nucleotidyltransferase [Gemmatimonadaceae bacterium]
MTGARAAGYPRARLAPPETVVEIARVLRDAGFETWCVGGAVRDALLGEAHLDWDLATAATPAEVRRLFRRTVPVGIEFGTVGVLDPANVMHEVTTFRRDVKTDGRHAVVEFGVSLDDDLARRDFTINAIAYDPLGAELRDPFGGQRDLAARVVRAVGDPDARMREDRLRALRAVRFAARFGFEIDPDTWRAVADSAPFMTRLSRERVKQEIEKTMQQVRLAGRAMRLWQESGVLAALIPALAQVSDVTLRSLDLLPRPATRGKPDREVQRIVALMADLSARDAERALHDLRFPNKTVSWVGSVLRGWAAIGDDVRRALGELGGPTDAGLRRWAGATGRTRARAVWRLGTVRFAAERELGRPAPEARAVASAYRRAMRIAFRDPVEIGDLAVDGVDLLAAGIAPGPGMKTVLEHLLAYVLEDPRRNTRDALLARAVIAGGR